MDTLLGPQNRLPDTQHPTASQSSVLSLQSSRWALSTRSLLQVVLFAGIFVLNFFEPTDPDLWWHLTTGRYILATRSIPTVDIFSYTAAGQPWVAHEWLAEIVMYLLYNTWGYVADVVIFAALITLAYWMVFRTLRLLDAGVIASTLITVWMAVMSIASWNVRPQIFSYPFFAIYLYLLLRFRRAPSRAIWLMPAIMLVWVNVHAGYIMGLLLLGLFIVGEAVNRVTGRWGDGVTGRGGEEERTQNSEPRTQNPPLRSYLLVTAATLAATVVNPQGPRILLYPLQYSGTQNASMKFVTEWQSPNFHNYYFFIFGAAILLLMVIRGRAPQNWALTLPVLVLTAMTLQSVRVIAFFAIAAGPFIASRLTGVRRRGVSELRTQNSEPYSQHSALRTQRYSKLNWLLLPVCLMAMASTLFLSDKAQLGREPLLTDYPAAGIQYIKQAGLDGNLFNSYQWGGFVIWSFYPSRRVFVDGRIDMYGDRLIKDYRNVYNIKPDWKDVLAKYNVQVMLIDKNSALATLLTASGEWKKVFQGPVESVFVRSTR